MATRSADDVRRIVLHDWQVDRPNYGHLLEADGQVVGCILAAYSDRTIGGRLERICNIGTWYVAPAFRRYSLPLSWKLGTDRGYTYTALTPNATSQALFLRGGYQVLASEYHMYLPGQDLGTRFRGARFTADPGQIERELDPIDRRIFRDHQPFDCKHLLMTVRGEAGYVYVVARRSKIWRRNLVPMSEILYASNKALAGQWFEPLKLAILLTQRSLVLATERRLLGDDAPLGKPVHRLRFFRSETLSAPDIDNLYSEAVLL
jgi:hypothetical protein